MKSAGRTNDAIFMASELLDLPEANDNVRPLKYAVSLTLSRIFTEKELNTFVPFVRHESEKQVIYRNRPMDLEVRYPAWFESEDNVKGEPGKMEGAFIGLAVAQREGKVHPVTLAVSANVLRSTFDAFVEKMLSAYQERYGGALHPVVPSLRSGARQYEGTYTEDGVVYRYDTIYFQHPKADITYLVVFVCPDKRYAELKKHYVFLVKNMKIGKVPPLKYELKLPPDVRK